MDNALFPDPVTHAQLMDAAAGDDLTTLRAYVTQGGNVDLLDATGNSALLVATRAGHEAFVAALLEAEPQFDPRWAGSALELANQAGRPDLAARLYDAALARARVVAPAELEAAIEQDDLRTVRRFLAQGNPPDLTLSTVTPLAKASALGHHAIAAVLLSAGADPCRLDDDDRSALDEAAGRGDDRMVQMLLEACVSNPAIALDPDAAAQALCAAVRNHHAHVTIRLMAAGASIVHPIHSALAGAAGRGDDEMVDLMLAAAASNPAMLSDRDAAAQALIEAARNHRRGILTRLMAAGIGIVHPASSYDAWAEQAALNEPVTDMDAAVDTLRILLQATEKDKRQELVDEAYRTLLHHAAENDAAWAIDVLVGEGIPVDLVVPDGRDKHTAFLVASESGSIGCLRRLAALGADIDRENMYGERALSAALKASYSEDGRGPKMMLMNASLMDVVACLLELGCDPTVPDRDGSTPRTRVADQPDLAGLMDAYVARRAMQVAVTAADVGPRT